MGDGLVSELQKRSNCLLCTHIKLFTKFFRSQWSGFNEGIFAVRYSLKTLSDNGFHNVAVNKATGKGLTFSFVFIFFSSHVLQHFSLFLLYNAGFGVGTWEYMLSHNATTHWESWWRSEDLYSHNHPMLGASAEWMASSVAGVSLYPTTSGGKEVLFWPRFPNSAKDLQYASAVSWRLCPVYSST